MDNDADELKIKFWACRNNKVICAVPKDFIQDASRLVSSVLNHSLPWEFSPVLGTILSKHKKIFQHKQYHVKDNNGEPNEIRWSCEFWCNEICASLLLKLYWFYDFVYKVMSPTGVWNYTQYANCQRIGCLAWNTSCDVSFTLQPCRISNLL